MPYAVTSAAIMGPLTRESKGDRDYCRLEDCGMWIEKAAYSLPCLLLSKHAKSFQEERTYAHRTDRPP